jgi:3-oxoacyl-[acyl-carrier protein] reductase
VTEDLKIRTSTRGAFAKILVTSAGGSFTPPGLEEISEEGWRASVDGNLTATFFTIKGVLLKK